jgi:hypothetical protein
MFSIGRIQNSHRFFNRYILIAISISMILLSGAMEREGEGSSNVVRTFMSAGMAGAGGLNQKPGMRHDGGIINPHYNVNA